MKCPKCDVEMRIVGSKIRFENDNTPDMPTKAIRVMTLQCVNSQCSGYTTEVEHEVK